MLRLISRVYWACSRWTLSIEPAPTRPTVLLGVPHTSNWDFVLMLGIAWRLGMHVRWLGKSSLFRGWRGPLMRKLGGTARVWRVDRMATVVDPATGDVQASFAPVAKHYGATVAACPPRRGNRKGVVEAAVRGSALSRPWFFASNISAIAWAIGSENPNLVRRDWSASLVIWT